MKAVSVLILVLLAGGVLASAYIIWGRAPQNNNQEGVVTLSEIISGAFPSATDKQGTGGVTVTVDGLTVLYVRNESDGDWHVGVTDGNYNIFITEITPAYQADLGRPVPGTVIDETGIVYCDTNHQTEAWHGNTCWEIHPVTSWHISTGAKPVTTDTYPGQNISASVAFGVNPIVRGSNQTISITVQDSGKAVVGIAVHLEVDYPSGTTSTFSCTTGSSGSCIVELAIPGDAITGKYGVVAATDGVESFYSFEVD